MVNNESALDPFFLEPPAPRDQLLRFIKTNITYDEIAHDIACGWLKSSIASLNKVVETILDVQYNSEKYTEQVCIGGHDVPAEEAAVLALQARWYDIELVLDKAAKLSKPLEDLPEYFLNTLCQSIGSLESYRFAAKQKAKRHKNN